MGDAAGNRKMAQDVRVFEANGYVHVARRISTWGMLCILRRIYCNHHFAKWSIISRSIAPISWNYTGLKKFPRPGNAGCQYGALELEIERCRQQVIFFLLS